MPLAHELLEHLVVELDDDRLEVALDEIRTASWRRSRASACRRPSCSSTSPTVPPCDAETASVSTISEGIASTFALGESIIECVWR